MTPATTLARFAARRAWQVITWPVRTTLGFFIQHLQRRGTALILFAACFVGVGVGVWHQVTPRELFYSQWPTWTRVTLWGGTACLAAMAAVIQRPQWQGWGFGALLLGPIERSLAYWVALVNTQNPVWIAGGCVWGLVAALIALIGGWPEPAPIGKDQTHAAVRAAGLDT